jgi:transposase-like protein
MATRKAARQPLRPTRSEVGGHTALTPTLQRRIVANITKGVHVEIAARAAGIHTAQFYRWIEQGRDKVDPETGETIIAPQPYRDFREAIEQAEAALELDLVNRYKVVARTAAFGNAQHLAGFLGRRFRARWDTKQAIEVSGPEGGPVKVEGTVDDRLGDFLAALARTGKITLGEPEGNAGPPDPEPAD